MKKKGAWILKRALEDRPYPMTAYRHFGFQEKGITEGSDYGIVHKYVLYKSKSSKEYFNLRCRDSSIAVSSFVHKNTPSEYSYYNDFRYCSCCEKHKKRYDCAVQFLDYSQFKAFFELNPDEEKKLPEQLKLHLNQNRTLYVGNSILNDIDPLCSIKNPWWVAGIDTRAEDNEISWRNCDPYLKIAFGLCGLCYRKLMK